MEYPVAFACFLFLSLCIIREHGRLRSKEYVRLTKSYLNCFNQNLRDSTFSEDQCHCPVWMFPEDFLQTFRFLSIMELVRLRQVCQTFKDEVDFLFGLEEKLGTLIEIFNLWEGPVHHDLLVILTVQLFSLLCSQFFVAKQSLDKTATLVACMCFP